MKLKHLLALACFLLGAGNVWAQTFTETYTLTGRGDSDWSLMLKNRSLAGKTFEVYVNGTNQHVLVWGGSTDSSGLDVGGREWGATAFAFRNVGLGDKVAITVADANTLSALSLFENSDKISYSDEGSTRTFSVNSDDVSAIEINFPANGTGVIITQIVYTYQMPSGFTKVTSVDDLNSTNFANNYYVISAMENPHLVLRLNVDNAQDNTDLDYQTQDVNNNLEQVWTLEANGDDGFSMRNVKTDHLLLQTESYGAYPIRLNDQPNVCEWTKLIAASDGNGFFTIANAKYAGNYLGLWSPENDYFSDEDLAANKTVENEIGHFNIYAIPRSTFNALYAASHSDLTNIIANPGFLNASGWTEYKAEQFVNIGTGVIGTFKPTGDTAATVDETHLNTEYCIGMQARWNTKYAAYQQTTSTLPVGHYELSYDVEDVNSSSVKINYDNLFYVEVGSNKYIDQSTEWMNAGKSSWTNHTISFDLTSASSAKISLGYGNKEDKNTTPIVYVSHLKLTYIPFANATDYANLNTAISAVEGKSWGFDSGDYAPYNYVDILEALAEAKAIDQQANNLQTIVQGLTSTLNGASWTANTTEVNAIFDGSFEHDYSGLTGNVQPLGWYRVKNTTDDGYNVRYVTKSSNAGVDYTSSDCALFTKLQAYYGWDSNYIMPLKANTYYTVSFIAGGAGDCDDLTNNIDIINPSEETTRIKTYTVPNKTANTDASSNSWMTVSATFKTGDAGNYVLGLVPRNSGNKTQNQFLYGDIHLVRAKVSEINSLLLEEITAANTTYNSGANVGTGVFQIPVADGTTFNTAINTAQGVYDNASATADDVANAIANLKAAEEAYANATLNAPAEDARYSIKNVTEGYEFKNKTLTFIANPSTNGGFNYQFANDAAEYYGQGFAFKAVEGETNQYYLYFTDATGTTQYVTNGTKAGSPAGWAASQIQTTTNEENALAIEVVANTGVDGVWNLKNTASGELLGANNNINLYSCALNNDLTFAPASQASVELSVAAGKLATRIFPFKPTLPEGVEAYACGANDGSKLTLTKVDVPEANKPYILYSKDGCASTTLTGWGTATADFVEESYLTGVYTRTQVPADSYVLQTQGGVQAFYKADGEGYSSAYRVYVTVPASASGVKMLGFSLDDMETAIEGIDDAQRTTDNAVVYNLAGQRLGKVQKGVNIINGKKVFVK